LWVSELACSKGYIWVPDLGIGELGDGTSNAYRTALRIAAPPKTCLETLGGTSISGPLPCRVLFHPDIRDAHDSILCARSPPFTATTAKFDMLLFATFTVSKHPRCHHLQDRLHILFQLSTVTVTAEHREILPQGALTRPCWACYLSQQTHRHSCVELFCFTSARPTNFLFTTLPSPLICVKEKLCHLLTRFKDLTQYSTASSKPWRFAI
jgi:hypothetical protein